MVAGLPPICAPEHAESVLHAMSVMVLVNLPGPSTEGGAGRTVMRAWVGFRISTVLVVASTAAPLTTRCAKSVPPVGPVTVAMTVRAAGIGEPVPAAAKPMLAGVTTNCCPAVPGFGGGLSSPPPWQPATRHATSTAAIARVLIFPEEDIDGSRRKIGS